MLTHLHPYQTWFTCGHRSTLRRGLSRPGVRDRPRTRQAPRAPLPGRGVTSPSRVSSTPSAGITLPSSLLRAHAPVQIPPATLVLPSNGGSLQVVVSPCWEMDLPDVTLRTFPDVPGPIPRRPLTCTYSFLPPGQRPSPILQRVGAPQHPGQPLQSRGSSRGCSHSLTFRPAGLLATQVAPTAAPRRGHWAAVASTPGHPTVRYLPVVQVC
jgi:hypothetical protein